MSALAPHVRTPGAYADPASRTRGHPARTAPCEPPLDEGAREWAVSVGRPDSDGQERADGSQIRS